MSQKIIDCVRDNIKGTSQLGETQLFQASLPGAIKIKGETCGKRGEKQDGHRRVWRERIAKSAFESRTEKRRKNIEIGKQRWLGNALYTWS